MRTLTLLLLSTALTLSATHAAQPKRFYLVNGCNLYVKAPDDDDGLRIDLTISDEVFVAGNLTPEDVFPYYKSAEYYNPSIHVVVGIGNNGHYVYSNSLNEQKKPFDEIYGGEKALEYTLKSDGYESYTYTKSILAKEDFFDNLHFYQDAKEGFERKNLKPTKKYPEAKSYKERLLSMNCLIKNDQGKVEVVQFNSPAFAALLKKKDPIPNVPKPSSYLTSKNGESNPPTPDKSNEGSYARYAMYTVPFFIVGTAGVIYYLSKKKEYAMRKK